MARLVADTGIRFGFGDHGPGQSTVNAGAEHFSEQLTAYGHDIVPLVKVAAEHHCM